MKLLVGPGLVDPKGNEAFLVKALKEFADVKTFSQNAVEFKQILAELPFGWNPDAILIRDAEFYKIPAGLEEVDSPIYALVGDYNLSFNQLLPVLSCFDYFFCDTKGVRIFNKLGFSNCRFFCLYGYDPELHRPLGLEKEWDIVFIGNLNHSVQQDREKDLYLLAQLGKEYRIHITTGVYGPEYAYFLNRSHLVFNRSIRDEANMRFFEALACDATVMNKHLSELDQLGFMANEHYLECSDLERAVVAYFKEWPAGKKEEMKQNAREILPNHTYAKRVENLIQLINQTPVDISARRFLQLSPEERRRRWARHRSTLVETRTYGKLKPFHPVLVRWQKDLVKNELNVRNFDINMWYWWIELLTASGLTSHLAQFLLERQELLQSFGCYKMVEKDMHRIFNQLVYGFDASTTIQVSESRF